MKLKNIIPILIIISLFSFGKAEAAKLLIVPDKDVFTVGDQFTAEVRIDSEGVGINAAQGTIDFPTSNLEVVSLSRTESVFNFWLEEPTFSNDTGKINFIGGSTSGFNGQSLKIIKAVFKVKSFGKFDINFSDGAVTASDGSGTNVLSNMQGVTINAVAKTGTTEIKPPQITREPTLAAKLPAKPIVNVSLYPDSTKWYNVSSKFFASWNLPTDVVTVATGISKDPTGVPQTPEGLFDNKEFSALADGVWYLHVQFKNNIGWGQINHYKIAIDTIPPAPFEISSNVGFSTDNPSPEISFTASDQLSGIATYEATAGGKVIKFAESKIKLLPQKPGKQTIKISAIDKAGNATEAIKELEIIPITSPVVINYSRDVYIGESGFTASGTVAVGNSVLINLIQNENEVVSSKRVSADENGNWVVSFEDILKKKKYSVEIIAEDSRGAQSLPISIGPITPKDRPFVVIFGLQITLAWFFAILLAILGAGFIGGIILNKLAGKSRVRKVIIAQRDIAAVFALLKKDIAAILKSYEDGKIEEQEQDEIKFYANRAKENIEKMQRYLVENIEDIKK